RVCSVLSALVCSTVLSYSVLVYRVRVVYVYVSLSVITGETWFVRTKEAVASYDLATGDKVWETSDVPNCVDEGWVDSLSMQDDVVVAATTCYEQPEDREDDVAWIAGWDFISELDRKSTRLNSSHVSISY